MKDVLLSLRSSQAERDAWEAAAGREPLSRWARRMLNEAAERTARTDGTVDTARTVGTARTARLYPEVED
jgi:hypothetical protein